MKQLIIRSGLLCLLFWSLQTHAQVADTKEALLVGEWMNGSKEARIRIFKSGDLYYGTISWLKNPLNEQGEKKVDKNNPDPTQRNRPLVGLMLLRSFSYSGKGEWTGGRIYDPKNGKDYQCKITLVDEHTLLVRGYIGISLIGRTDTWTR